MHKQTIISNAIPNTCEWPARPMWVPMLERIRYLVEETPWDREALKLERWLDRICWLSITVAVLYFLPVAFSICTR
jgi:hypothetical protein